MFRYTVDFPLNGKAASYILRNLSGGNGKLVSKKFKYVGFGFGKQYASLEHDYELNFDHDMGFLKFNIDLKDKIGAIMDQITDIVGAQRGEYTIMDNETDEEVCLDALNDEYPSTSSKHNSFRYSVRLYPNNVKSIQEAIYTAHPNIVLTDCEQEYECEQFLIDIDGNESVGFYFNQTKLDINYINSIIYPVMKALNYKRFDYVVDDNRTGEEIVCEADFIDEDPEHGFVSNSYYEDDDESTCSSYEFGQPTADEAEEWLAELEEEQEQEEYIYNVYNNIRETNYADMCESDAEDNSDDEWLPPVEQRKKDRVLASANKRALKEEAKKAEKALKKVNMTEEEKAAYAAKVEAIIADRRAKKAARLQAEEEVKKEEELHKAAYNEMYALEEVTARREAKREEKERKERIQKKLQKRIQKKLQRLHRQLN